MPKGSGLNKLEIESYHDYNTLLQSWVFECLTMLDIYSLKWLNRDELKALLFNVYEIKNAKVHRTKKDIPNEATLLLRINQVYKKTISFLEKDLLLKIPKQHMDKNWRSVDEFITFMQWLTQVDRKWYDPIIECAILKTMNAVHDILDNPHVSGLEHKLEYTVSTIVRKNKNLILKAETDTEKLFVYNNPLADESDVMDIRNPEIRIIYRAKQFEKIVQKNIGDRKYSSVNLLRDIIWVRIEVSHCSDAQILELMTDVAQSVFAAHCEFDQKNEFISPDGVKKLLLKNTGLTIRNGGVNAKSDENYQDAKFIGSVKWPKGMTFDAEIQFVHIDNKNESGFSNHHILDMKKILTDVARLFWTLTVGNIKVAIQTIGLKSGIREKAILSHLFFPWSQGQLWFLIPIQMENGTIRYITKSVYKETFHKLYRWFPKIVTMHIDGITNESSTDFSYSTFLEQYNRIKS